MLSSQELLRLIALGRARMCTLDFPEEKQEHNISFDTVFTLLTLSHGLLHFSFVLIKTYRDYQFNFMNVIITNVRM